MLRRIRRSLRDIRRYSKPKSADMLDRVQEWAFIAAFFLAPLAVWIAERALTSTITVRGVSTRVFLTPKETALAGFAIEERERGHSWVGVTPMAEIDVVRKIDWGGWPLATREVRGASVLATTLLPSCPESRRAEAEAVARRIAEAKGAYFAQSETRIHFASWIFSSLAWWMMLVFAAALLIVPLRLARRVRKRVRNTIRQGRIARARCPNCGYDARRTAIRGLCPECGGEVYERPEY